MPRFSKKAKRHAKESRMRSERSIKEAAARSGPVKITYLPGFAPPSKPSKFPFTAVINGRRAIVTKEGGKYRFEYDS